jgi:hypothetical protein
VNWPAQSSNLNRLNFWLCRDLKHLAYSAPINEINVLEFSADCAPLCDEELKVVSKSMATTQHLLQRSYEHRPYLSRHWFMDIC